MHHVKLPHARRYSSNTASKASGATYTPPALASFVARQMLRAAKLPARGVIRMLDPAVGDGALLAALIEQLPQHLHARLEVSGFDTDEVALASARQRLALAFPNITFHLEARNFLDHALRQHDRDDLLRTPQPRWHLLIANPPYVRTQVIGAALSRQLARDFGLSGRVDLYHAFLLAMAAVLDPRGTAGIIVSNRFMTTKSGQTLRCELLARYRLAHVWDLGDSKLFDAAVLPAVLVAHGVGDTPTREPVAFSSLYETTDTAQGEATDPLAALAATDDSVLALPDGRRFRARHGQLDNGSDAHGVWRVATDSADRWLETVAAHTWANFARIGKVRVGVKSTADKVFVRTDWDSLPGGRPELLRPLTTRHVARPFRALPPTREILYPHISTPEGRETVALEGFPRAARYLRQHRATLEARDYLIAAGRRWYELWVPQQPDAWRHPKLVFPDIAAEPVCWMDRDGSVVNGECYWIKADHDGEEDLLWLALAVANSSFIGHYYDHRFHNKLYAGRRRFVTQYVETFPLPDPASSDARAMVDMAKTIHALTPSAEADRLATQLDDRVWQVFGGERLRAHATAPASLNATARLSSAATPRPAPAMR